ncbi:endosome-associated ubiquitin isopeptidase [Ophiostoma piceae UAMH 11346]|uniref:Endosome-associated ubiquitin isopeptidase n=1 Tax=Ophiostoma piceae (strain UAMH 11346) TaxID=1262450 RepID=S3CFY0_OPHP1|nr:endosome-associated ubiquitin isopeptidase [Ophiostoma piceae UAMH 11346]
MSRPAYAPLSVQELARSAEMFEWRPQIPLKFHIGSLDAMYREGLTYYEEHNYAKAYVLLMRYSVICVDKIPTHPEATTPEARRMIRVATRRLSKTVMPLLESIKQDLDEARRQWERRAAAAASTSPSARKAVPAGPRQQPQSVSADPGFAARDPALSWNPHSQAELLDASENVNLAVELANRRRVGRDKEGAAGRVPVPRRPVPPHNNNTLAEDDVRSGMERARWQLEEMERRPQYERHGSHRSSGTREPPNPVPVSYNYPSVRQSTPVQFEAMRFDDGRRDESAAARPTPPPKRPTFDTFDTSEMLSASATPPPVPVRGEPYPSRYNSDLSSLKLTELPSTQAVPPTLPPKTREEATALAPPSPPQKKSSYTFKPAAYLENGTPIRSVFLPDTLRGQFLKIAQPNTARGIETCGILCGKTANNALFITCLLIPQQIGTTDSCETTEEVETFEYCSAEDLIQIGWIHTHPTQTCFMSSLDMHTHAGYQMMMDESIAIVCAPKFEPSWGIFRLTNPPGLPYIVGCRKGGAFHEHDLRPHEIYREAKNPPGHVFVVPGIDYKVADLRSKSS